MRVNISRQVIGSITCKFVDIVDQIGTIGIFIILNYNYRKQYFELEIAFHGNRNDVKTEHAWQVIKGFV